VKETSPTAAAVGRAGRRAVYHLLQAAVEGLKALEAVIEELGDIRGADSEDETPAKQKIEIE
jgi:hypothetical protein